MLIVPGASEELYSEDRFVGACLCRNSKAAVAGGEGQRGCTPCEARPREVSARALTTNRTRGLVLYSGPAPHDIVRVVPYTYNSTAALRCAV